MYNASYNHSALGLLVASEYHTTLCWNMMYGFNRKSADKCCVYSRICISKDSSLKPCRTKMSKIYPLFEYCFSPFSGVFVSRTT